MQYGLIGEKLPHSFSPEIHALFADYDYRICELSPDELDAFMKKRDFLGINVTIPYKKAVIEYLDYISDEAKSIGAVNTVVNKDGRLYGYNTDFAGLKGLILHEGMDISGKKVLILGTGGTSLTARAVAESLGASEIFRASRHPEGEEISYEEAYGKHSDAEVIINTTPVGMFPNVDAVPLNIERFPALYCVVDAIYNPLRTRLVSDAKKRGIKACGGLYMLMYQGACAAELFSDIKVSDSDAEAAFRKILAKKENIVLTGMPSSGKTTVGALLSKKLSLPVYDSDALIKEKIGCEISDFFANHGETAFRDVEGEVIEALSQKTGCIISTGGGAILRAENVENLKRNGRIYFLDRPIEKLIFTPDRPLSSNAEALKKRFDERYGIYCDTADLRVDADGTPEECAEIIIKDRR